MKIYDLGICEVYINENNGKFIYSLNENYNESINSKEFQNEHSFDINNKDYFYECVNISINITKNCNFACKYCFNKNKSNLKISIDVIKNFIEKVISDTPKAIKYQIDLSGSGEPLLELEKIIEIAKFCSKKQDEIRKEILVMFVSNGYLLTSSVAQKLQENSILFGVSIDGIGKYHDENRITKDGKPTYKKIIKNIKSIKNMEFVGCAMTISNSKVNILKSAKVLKKYFNTISIKISRGDSNLDFELLKNEYTKLADYIIDSFSRNDVSLLIRLLNGDDYFGRYLITILTKQVFHHRCDAGIGKFSMDTDGKVYVCSAAVGIEKLGLGNYDDFNYDKGRELVGKASCKNCEIKMFCGNECLVRYYTNGINDGMCKLKKHFFKLSLVISAILEFKYPHLYNSLIDFIDEKADRFLGDKKFLALVDKATEYSYSYIKHLYDFDRKKYEVLLEKYNIYNSKNIGEEE